ncbi:MAG: Catalytic domain of components of various dehydrogenase complexe, partial [Caldanaerobacter subterraneus]
MPVNVVMPKLGLTMKEGRVDRWLKKVGDIVKKGEEIVEVSTD